jgi:predicted transcriptional regulator
LVYFFGYVARLILTKIRRDIMSGLGKKRSRLGKWLDARGITQTWLVKKSKRSKTTITTACSDDNYIPSGSSIQRIIKALREIDPTVSASKFWDV